MKFPLGSLLALAAAGLSHAPGALAAKPHLRRSDDGGGGIEDPVVHDPAPEGDINPADLLKCVQASDDKDACDGTDTSDGGHCAWCSSDTLQKSFCTVPEAGEAMKQFIQDLECDDDATSGSSTHDENADDLEINPADILTCIQAADKDGCDGTETSDGGHCSWCSSDTLQQSFCTTSDAGDAMKQFIQDLECDGDASSSEIANDVGINPADILTCIQAADKDGCDGTETSDGGHCSWCSSDTLQQSFCTTSDAGDAMKQFIQDLECDGDASSGSMTSEIANDVGINPADILTCIQAADKDGCDGTETSDGGHCSWCSSDTLQQSFCTTSDAGDAMKQFIQDLECDSSSSSDTSPDSMSNDVVNGVGISPGDMMKCLQIDDKDGCDAMTISDGGHCSWCTSERFEQRFCVIPEAADGMKQYIQDLECDNGGKGGYGTDIKLQ